VNGVSKISTTDFPVTCTTGYRFTFNGMEKDDEVKGIGNSLDFGARIYDPRLGGRFFSLDPLQTKYPGISPYCFVANSPIAFVDPDGKDIKPASNKDWEIVQGVFNSFSTKKVSADVLFGITPNNYKEKDGRIVQVYGTNLSNDSFEKNLSKSGLSNEQNENARAVFKLLSSNDVIEIAVVSPSSTGSTKSSEKIAEGEDVVQTDNPNSDPLFNGGLNESMSTSDRQSVIDKALSNADIKGENFGFFKDDKKQENSVSGILVVTPPNENVNNNSRTMSDSKTGSSNATVNAVVKTIKIINNEKQNKKYTIDFISYFYSFNNLLSVC